MIVKCQRSITTSEKKPQMLFYNQEQTMLAQFDLNLFWSNLFAEDYRFFAEVDWTDESAVPLFKEKVPEQEW